MSKSFDITCPFCGRSIRADQAIADADLRRLLMTLAHFGRAAGVVRDYIRLFRSAPKASMRVATQLKHAQELLKLWQDGLFYLEGKNWPITHAQIIDAIHEVLRAKADGYGFRNHTYLKKVMLRAARSNEIAAENRREAERRAGANRPADTEPAEKTPDQMTTEELKVFFIDMHRGGGIGPTLGVTKQAGRLLRKRKVDTEALLKEAGLEGAKDA